MSAGDSRQMRESRITRPRVIFGIATLLSQVLNILPGPDAVVRWASAGHPPAFLRPPSGGVRALNATAPMLGVLAGIIGTIQATEALKLVLGIGRPLTDRIMDFDAKKTQFREIKVKRNPSCALCGDHPTITELFDDGDPYAGCAVKP